MQSILTLGKIILILFPILSIANVSSSIDKKIAIKGEAVTFQITAVGADIEFPTINSIAGHKIVGTSSSSQIHVINGNMKKQKTVHFKFLANKSVTIEKFKVIVDGKEYETKSLELKVKEPEASKDGDDLQLKLTINKHNVYVGEAIIAKLEFKYKTEVPVVNLNLEEFNQKNLWIKPLNSSKQFQEGNYNIVEKNYILFPQVSGKIDIDKLLVTVDIESQRGGFFSSLRRENIYSNGLTLEVKPLPKGINIQGDYKLTTKVDKNSVDTNKPVNFTVEIEGNGNIDDIDEIDLKIDNAVVYNTKPELKTYVKNGVYGGKIVQKFSIISSSSYTIPSIEIKYFDINSQEEKLIKSQVHKINVNNTNFTASKIETNLESSSIVNENFIQDCKESTNNYLHILISFLVGTLVSWLVLIKRKSNKEKKPIIEQIRKAKNDNELYKILLPFSDIKELKDIMKLIELNIYNSESHKIDKKSIINILDNYEKEELK